jgi:hypothetical protein
MSVLLFLIVLYILLGLSMMKLFEKAGVPAWKALVPGLAAVEWCKLVGRKPQYALWFLFPVVNFFIYAGMVIDLVRSFGKHSFWYSVLAVVYAPLPFFLVGRDSSAKYEGPILEKEREYHRLHHEAIGKKMCSPSKSSKRSTHSSKNQRQGNGQRPSYLRCLPRHLSVCSSSKRM